MAYNYNPSSSGGKDHKSAVQGQPGNNLARPNLNNEPGMIVHVYNFSYMGGLRQEDQSLRPAQSKTAKPYLKHN
jgi:hypothetical protein